MPLTLPGAEVAVIGGGIVGAGTALQLQRAGHTVTVIERGIPGDEATGHNGGQIGADVVPIATPGLIRDLPYLLTDPDSPLVIQLRYLPTLAPWLVRFALASRPQRVEQISIALHSLTSRSIDAYRPLVTGTAAEGILRNRGTIAAYRKYATLEKQLKGSTFELRRRRGVAWEVLTPDDLAAREPALKGLFEAGVYYPNNHFTDDPGQLARTLIDDAVVRGGRLLRAEVTSFVTGGGRVQRVRTDQGDLAVDAIVITAGPWSRKLARQLGTNVPLEAERGYGADLPHPGMHLEHVVGLGEDYVALPPYRGGIRVVGIDELASLSAPADMSILDRSIRATKRLFPALDFSGAKVWMRQRPSTPDSLAVIGRAPRYQNAYFNFGHGHKGVGQGAITGKLVQELMDGLHTTVDLTPYSPTRFRFAR